MERLPLHTSYRAAFATWRQREILLDLLGKDKAPIPTTTIKSMAKRLGYSHDQLHRSLLGLSRRGYVDMEGVPGTHVTRADDPNGWCWFLTEEGLNAAKNLK
jgi:DNA-binding MarR family transcriptional regulator